MAKVRTPTDHHVRVLLLRGICLSYFVSFVSLGVQLPGLIGPDGISPWGDLLAAASAEAARAPVTGLLPVDRMLTVPTLGWWLPLRGGAELLAFVGAAAAVLGLAARWQRPALAVAWICWLSLVGLGQRFLSFQWDTLLVEAGLLALLLAPPAARPAEAPPPVAMWAFRLLVFRLMFFSGWVKLASGDPTWRDLSAMTHHYETQPLPNPLSWYAHHLPTLWHQVEAVVMFGVELLLPFAVFGARRPRAVAFAGFTLLLGMLALTGNYGVFQLLSLVVCLSLLDDEHLSVLRRGRAPKPSPPSPRRGGIATAIVAALWMLAALQGGVRYLRVTPPAPVAAALDVVAPWHLTSAYGLFAVMTTERPVPVLEGRWGDGEWTELTWRWQPTDPAAAPPTVAPHMPRVDWMLWFAGLGTCDRNPWATALLQRVVDGSAPVADLVGDLRLQGAAPDAARLVLYRYRFTEPGSPDAAAGRWWTREAVTEYCPAITRDRR